MKNTFYTLLLAAIMVPSIMFAHQEGGHDHKSANPAVRKYIKEQVMPVLLQKRQAFDRELTSGEKAEIEACRVAMKQLKEQHATGKEHGTNVTKDEDVYYGQKREADPAFEQRKSIMQRLQVIADKHSNSLQEIKTQLEPSRKQWINDIKGLMPTNTDEKSGTTAQQKWHHHGPEDVLNPHHLAAHFLLLPATTNTASTPDNGVLKPDINTGSNQATAPGGLSTLQISPNPASTDLQLGNEMLPANNVLKVIDMQGKEVLTLENVQAAQHLDISHLAAGTYLIQIKSGAQTISKKVVINR